MNDFRATMHRVVAPGFLDPRWLSKVRHGPHEGKAIDRKTFEVEGQYLGLELSDSLVLVPGQQVFLYLLGNFFLETGEERAARLAVLEAEQRKQQEGERTRRNAVRQQAESFNAALCVPVCWLSGMKDVLAGLSGYSAGNGANAATVVHIWLQEPLHDGRMRRERGDFLCTPAGGSNGKQWSGQVEADREDGDGNRYQAQVTGKSCLKIACRWAKES
jgi:hypothetical protein